MATVGDVACVDGNLVSDLAEWLLGPGKRIFVCRA
jgi:hypothetical protein